ncbi:MAG: hypothetical protein IT569_00805, partial [Leptospiraceae bacterium]|nr:hypothetical protein [Leptospiraceae bacterium]
MKDEEALELVNETFKKLIESKTINDVNEIINRSDILKKNQMSKEKYPKIDFKITSDEIKKLKENAIITNGLISKSIVDSDPPLTKLFYAVLWKNGDLDKLKHIIEGIAVPEDS